MMLGKRSLLRNYLILLFVCLYPTVSCNNDDNGQNNIMEEPFNPMGLQVWDTTASFNQALDGRGLVLVIITTSWCDQEDVEILAAQAAEKIDDIFLRIGNESSDGESTFGSVASLAKPLIGLMPYESASQLVLDGLAPISHYPALKFVSTPLNCSKDDGGSGEISDDDETKIWDYILPRESAEDIYDSVMMYWSRTVLSTHISNCREATNTRKQSKTKTESMKKHNPPIFEFTSQTELISFLEIYGERVLRPARATHQHQNRFEKEMFEFYTGLQNYNNSIGGIFYPFQQTIDEDGGGLHDDHVYTQEIDPYILFVQCRLSGRSSAKEKDFHESKKLFEDLATEMLHRTDVAFFALDVTKAKLCSGWFPAGKIYDGAIAAIRVERRVHYSYSTSMKEKIDNNFAEQSSWDRRQHRAIQNIITEWNGMKRKMPLNVFVPAEYSTNEDVMSNLTKFTVIHTTPTVMWFDTSRVAQFAFPAYRKVHAVLFIDLGIGHELTQIQIPVSTTRNDNKWPGTLSHSPEIERLLLDQQRAVQMFYNAAIQYRSSEHKNEDVVFLIVPSSETRILNTFGIDIWTRLDEALFGVMNEDGRKSDEEDIDEFTCRSDSSPMMPIMAVTDTSDRSGKQASRYYFCSDDISAPSDVLFENGGAMKSFIDKTLNGTAVQFTRSEWRDLESGDDVIPTSSNVTVVTGNTFHSLVMEREAEHTMLLIKTLHCGHCKRFSIFWNEFQTIIQALNWSSVINVCKIDVSKNDVPHPNVDAWDLPSVYYFPAGEKQNPIEMAPKYDIDSIDAQYDYDEGLSWVTSGYDVVEWILRQGKLDLELLASLDAAKTNAIKEDS